MTERTDSNGCGKVYPSGMLVLVLLGEPSDAVALADGVSEGALTVAEGDKAAVVTSMVA